jgi:zinc D-Ala-D-Ala carboxypeptidase
VAPPETLRQARIRQSVALVVVLVLIFALVKLVSAVGGGGDGDPRSTVSPPAAAPPADPDRPLPACAHGDRPALKAEYPQWPFTLVDTTYRLGEAYQPDDLVSAEEAGFAGPFLVRSFLIEDLRALREAAEAAGHPIEIEAAHRTYGQQGDLFDQRVADLGIEEALKKVARPGHSEHQLGTTADFKTAGADDVDLTWASTPAGSWTIANAPKFGFVMSYPEGGLAKTCYRYEPWHFRYFGRERALRLAASGLTTREYLWREVTATPPG